MRAISTESDDNKVLLKYPGTSSVMVEDTDTESEMYMQDAVYSDIADLLKQLADKVELLGRR